MKKLILSLCLLSNLLFAQEKFYGIMPLKDKVVNYSEVIQLDSINKDELYKNAKNWLIDNYKSAKDVIQLDSKESGELTGIGFFSFWWTTFFYTLNLNCWQTFKIHIKDNKYKYEITNVVVKYTVPSTPSAPLDAPINEEHPIEDWNIRNEKKKKEAIFKMDAEIQKMIGSLKTTMSKKPQTDW